MKIPILFLFLLVCSTSVFGQLCQKYRDQGKALYESGKYSEAMQKFQGAAKVSNHSECTDLDAWIFKTKEAIITKTKSPQTVSKIAKFDTGDGKGEFMVVTGAFSSENNAKAQIYKVKRLGFAGSEIVKLPTSNSFYGIAGYYEFKVDADAAVRALKVNKIEAYSKKIGRAHV